MPLRAIKSVRDEDPDRARALVELEDRTDAHLDRSLAPDERRVPDLDAGYVGDRVQGSGLALAGDAQVAGARLSRRACDRLGGALGTPARRGILFDRRPGALSRGSHGPGFTATLSTRSVVKVS